MIRTSLRWQTRPHCCRNLKRSTQKIHASAIQLSEVQASDPKHEHSISGQDSTQASAVKKRKKTLAEIDEELRAAMEGRAGDGGLAGAELEGGKAVAMKRGVRENMFRYI